MSGISLIMATIGRVEEVRRFVDRLHLQTYREFELIVVDQNPDDRLVPVMEEARAMGILLRHLRQTEPNLSLARNAGLACAANPYVAFPDDDCWYELDTLALIMARLTHPDAPQGVIARWQEWSDACPVSQTSRTLSNEKWRRFAEHGTSSITLFFARNLIDQVGGFDTTFGVRRWFGSGEETDLLFRILATGAKVGFMPEAVVHHVFAPPEESSIPASFRRARGRARGTGGICAKHKVAKWVILRGFFAPLVRALFTLNKPMEAARQVGTSVGILEGYVHWQRQTPPSLQATDSSKGTDR